MLVTGSSSGIGAATAAWLIERGYVVLAGVRRIEQGESLKATVADERNLVPVVMDVANSHEVSAAAAQVAAELRKCEISISRN